MRLEILLIRDTHTCRGLLLLAAGSWACTNASGDGTEAAGGGNNARPPTLVEVARLEAQIGVRFPGFVEILSGVEPGTQVVVGGLERLFEGAPVAATVVER